jgi:F0F1-type ATP synthase beta subunit
MLKVKIVTIKYVSDFVYPVLFKTYIAENGNVVYVADGKLTTKEDGNKFFQECKESYKVDKITVMYKAMNEEEVINYYKKGIDEYIEYIDDWNQQEQARKYNNRMREIINAIEKAIA